MAQGYYRPECKGCEHWHDGTYLQPPRCTALMHGVACKHSRPGEAIFVNHKQFDPPAGVVSVSKAIDTQVGGSHYKDMGIQPVEYVHANGIGYFEGCAIKYLSRWRKKNGIEDLRKAIHFIELLIELEGRKTPGK